MPHWLLMVLLASPMTAVLLRRGRRRLIHRTRRRRGRCVTCGYDLRASPGRCPECGMPGPHLAAAAEAVEGCEVR